MNWQLVERIIRDKIIAKMTKPNNGIRWMQGLHTCKDGYLLGVCIAIDVESGALDPKTYADILDGLRLPLKDARLAFGRVVRSQRFLGLTNFVSTKLNPTDSYVRIMDLVDFIEYYIHPDFKLTSSPRDIHIVKAMFFKKRPPASLSLIRNWTAGPTGRVWIISNKEYKSLVRGKGEREGSTLLNDAVGLGYKRKVGKEPEIIALLYPPKFSVGVYQPTSLDAQWVRPGGYYVAFGEYDSWGRTHSVSGIHQPVSERIHSLFKGLTHEYRLETVGASRPIKPDRGKLLEEAFRRLHRINKKSPPFP
jgi:hypothetical protein